MRRRLARARLWTNNTELLAQLIEVTSVLAAERRLEEPITIRRPSWISSPSGRNAYSDAIARMRASGPARRA